MNMRITLSRTVVGRACAANIRDPLWWEEVRRIVALGKKIIHLLRMCDAIQPCIGKIYESMDKMVEKLAQIEPDVYKYQTLQRVCHDRWDAYHSPMHAAAFVVDPQFQTGNQERDVEVMDSWDEVLERLQSVAAKQRLIRDQLADKKGCKCRFARANSLAD
eukprot:c12183_g1_i1 orf=1-480(-)